MKYDNKYVHKKVKKIKTIRCLTLLHRLFYQIFEAT